MMKPYRDAWAVSLLVIACVTIVLTVCSFAGIDLPDVLARTLGVGVRVLPMEAAGRRIAGRSARLLRIENGKSARPFSLF